MPADAPSMWTVPAGFGALGRIGASLAHSNAAPWALDRMTQRMQVVVRREEDLARIPLVDSPIDFEQEMALVMTLGRTVSEQQSIRITRVWRQGRQLRVAIETAAPARELVLRESTPFCVAIVPKCELEVAGFKPEFGSIDIGGVIPLAHTLDTLGPLAPDIHSTARAYSMMSGESVSLDAIARPRLAVHALSRL